MKKFCLLISLLSSSCLFAAEYGQIRFTGTESTPDTLQTSKAYSSVTLHEGDVFELLQVMANGHVNIGGTYLLISHNGNEHGIDFYGGFPKRKVVGPGQIYFSGILGSYSSHQIAFYKITRANEAQLENVNVITATTLVTASESYELNVESSFNLNDWVLEYSSPLNGDYSYFRTRIIDEGGN